MENEPGKRTVQNLINVRQVAEMCSIGVETVYRKQRAGEMPAAIRLGRCCRWRPEHINEWIEKGCPNLNLD